MSCSSFRTLIPPGIVSVLPVAHALTKLWRTHTGIGRLRRPLRWQTMTGLTFVARMRRCTWLKHALRPRRSWFRRSSVPPVCVPPCGPLNWGLPLLWPTRKPWSALGGWSSRHSNPPLEHCGRWIPNTLPSPNACGGFVLIRSNQSCSRLPVARFAIPLFLICVT